jgi:hypothetical protein
MTNPGKSQEAIVRCIHFGVSFSTYMGGVDVYNIGRPARGLSSL